VLAASAIKVVSRRQLVAAPGHSGVAAGYPAVFANGSVRPLVAIGCAITKKGSKVLPVEVRPS
jgi:hypothetical protein